MSRRAVIAVVAVSTAVVAVCITVVVLIAVLHDPAPGTATAGAASPGVFDRPFRPTTASASPTRTASPTRPTGQVMDVSPQADAAYLGSLSDLGLLKPGDDREAVIRVGRLVCAYISAGQGDVHDAAIVVQQSGGATPSQATGIVAAAVDAYCPQYG